MKKTVTVDEWVALFRETGLDDAQMKRWHRAFEKHHPDAHETFLGWLGLPSERIARIREESR
jgi:hypothetical protein